jgi:hypothetical protein
MMQPVLFKVQLFRDTDDRPRSQEALLWMLEALCKINEGHLAQKPYPPLYESGVRYAREPGTERWLDIPSILDAGVGDCEDLACWRVAELRRQGVHAGPYVRYRSRNGVFHYHALVMHYRRAYRRGRTGGLIERWVPAKIEDPSRKLGMGRPADRVQQRLES